MEHLSNRLTPLIITCAVGAAGAQTPPSNCCAVSDLPKMGFNPQSDPIAAGDNFGFAVDVHMTTAVVGAFLSDNGGQDSGRVRMYRFENGQWIHESSVSGIPARAGDFFGNSVSVSDNGDVAIIGAQFHDEVGPDVGAAFVFRRGAGGAWSQEALLRPNGGDAGDLFGFDVASAGTWAVVGRPQSLRQPPGNGKFHIYVKTSGVWTIQQSFAAPDGASGDNFAASVAIGDYILAGAKDDDDRGTNSGSVYVYSLENGVNYMDKIVPPDLGVEGFGHDVAVTSGGLKTLLIGAPGTDGGEGAAYFYKREGNSWTSQRVDAPDGASVDLFGFSVAIDRAGESAVIGAVLDDHAGQGDAGSSYLYRLINGTWTFCEKIVADDPGSGDTFARCVAMDSGHIIIGADGGDDYGSNSGSAYPFEFECGPVGPPSSSTYTTQTFVVFGDADDVAWSWRIASPTGAFEDIENQSTAGVSPCEPGELVFDDRTGQMLPCTDALKVVRAFADSINTVAAENGWDTDVSDGTLALRASTGRSPLTGATFLSLSVGGAFDLYVGDAGVEADRLVRFPGPPQQFNPSMEEAPLSGLDCNNNLYDDALDIDFGTSSDNNGDGRPDECGCHCEVDGQPGVTILDMLEYLSAWFAGEASAERNGDGEVTVLDLLEFLACWFAASEQGNCQ